MLPEGITSKNKCNHLQLLLLSFLKAMNISKYIFLFQKNNAASFSFQSYNISKVKQLTLIE